MTSLKGRVAIVTGAGRGLGPAIAIKLAESGAIGPIAFLASEEAAFITGQALVVDGGLYKIS